MISAYPKCNAPRASVFEDDIATFKEESTPIEFSTATSLSSLTIDDEVKMPSAAIIPNESKEASNDTGKSGKVDSPADKPSNAEAEKDQEQVSDGDEDDEDMLAACISMGIQNNRCAIRFRIPFEAIRSLFARFKIYMYICVTGTVNPSRRPRLRNPSSRNHRTPWLAARGRQL